MDTEYCLESQTPFFSICVPVYNAKRYLKDCIESILRQSEKDYEIVLIDDGSVDGSGKICDEYSSAYKFVKVVHKENEGPLIARDVAVRNSTGKFLMFIDADDVFYPEILKSVRSIIEELDADMCFFDFSRFFPDGTTEVQTEEYSTNTLFTGNDKRVLYSKLILETSFNSLCRKCISRKVYDWDTDYSEYSGMIQGEDKFISFPILDCAERIVYLKEALYGYRVNYNSTTYNITLKNYKDVRIVNSRSCEYIQKWNLQDTANAKQKASLLEFGIGCISHTFRRMQDGKATMDDLKEAISFVGSDVKFKEAYETSGSLITWYQRGISKMVLDRKVDEVVFILRCTELLRKIARKVGVGKRR